MLYYEQQVVTVTRLRMLRYCMLPYVALPLLQRAHNTHK
jgi:hypothetical protein